MESSNETKSNSRDESLRTNFKLFEQKIEIAEAAVLFIQTTLKKKLCSCSSSLAAAKFNLDFFFVKTDLIDPPVIYFKPITFFVVGLVA
jgi:hypothetical protein